MSDHLTAELVKIAAAAMPTVAAAVVAEPIILGVVIGAGIVWATAATMNYFGSRNNNSSSSGPLGVSAS